tara:strand:+ start:3307 stop:7353 length:4047 start_codon:yes stop_codon:yes gene_type:complete
MNGGKDVKIGHDKRPVSVIPSDEQPLFNIANGIRLTDEFGNPLVTKVDQFFVGDASKKRATSVVFPTDPLDKYNIATISQVGVATGVTYGVNLDVDIPTTRVGFNTVVIPVLQVNTNVVGVGSTTPGEVKILENDNTTVTLSGFPVKVEARTLSPTGLDKNKIYFTSESRPLIDSLQISDTVSGFNIPDGSYVLGKTYDRIEISKYITSGINIDDVTFFRQTNPTYEADNVLKIAEQFKETSEVSSTLLGIDRAEVQLSLFSNVSSYGLNKDDWETYQYNSGTSKASWERRVNKIYGRKYEARIEEETQESAIKLSAFPVSYSFPYGEIYQKIGLYNKDKYDKYIDFIKLGNAAYNYYSGAGNNISFATNFLNPNDVRIESGDVFYSKVAGKPDDFTYAFSKIDTWSTTWGLLRDESLPNPAGGNLGFAGLKDILNNNGIPNVPSDDGAPGYNTNYTRFSAIQSRRVFRYQPGRISGFTFGLRSSIEKITGVVLEWGIANTTDQYMFRIYGGFLSIIRRSTVPLSREVLVRNGLDPTEITSVRIGDDTYNTVQPEIPSGDPFDVKENFGPYSTSSEELERAIRYHTIEIPRDKFNGDPLNGNGPSGYTIEPDNVTMWKIEFGWYGAIGARFYAYIPAGAGEARWVVVHTLVIENSLTGPCLEDSYFRFKYTLKCSNNERITTPQFLYKYGASYYIDGGDEGTTEIYSVNTGLNPKTITANESTIFGVRPKDVFYSVTGIGASEIVREIANRRLILPTKMSMSTNALTEVKVRTCVGCKGHAHVITPGVGTTISGREIELIFTSVPNQISIVGTGASFTESDIGSKLIAPSIFNAYIIAMGDDTSATTYPNGLKTYTSAKVAGWGPGLDGYPNYNENVDETSGGRTIGGALVKDYGQGGIITTIPTGDNLATDIYPHKVRLSSYNEVHFASDQELSGTEIKIQFLNPRPKDGISSYRSNTHFADFLIGVTDKKPTVGVDGLEGWDSSVLSWTNYTDNIADQVGQGTTTILPNENILYGESTHTWGGMNEDGAEVNERWSPSEYRVRMGEDVRTPVVANPSGGVCSSVKIVVSESTTIAENVLYVHETTDIPGGGTTSDAVSYFVVKGAFGGGITDWLGGQVVTLDPTGPNDTITAKYNQRKPVSFVNDTSYFQGAAGEYIALDSSIYSADKSNITLLGRTVTLTANKLNETKIKLFNYSVYPLYLVGKLRDNSKINNIMITEKSGDFQKTTTPKLYVTENSNGSVDTVSGDALNDQTPPPNFLPIDRLSSATVDTQNLRDLRKSVVRDTFFVGEDETKEIDMTKVFGVDRNVITPDNLNIDATFITAKNITTSSSGNKFIQSSLNFKEQ